MRLLALLPFALVLTSCASLTIARINADPSRFRGQVVHVTGTVVISAGIMNTGGYQIEDGTGRIWVLSRSGVPSAGSRVTVTGKVLPVAQVLGQPLGTAIQERQHKLR